jgi:hypothetical protein
MKIFKVFIGAFLLLATTAHAQFFGPARNIIRLPSDPSPCTDGQVWYNTVSTLYEGCAAGIPYILGGGGIGGTGTVTSVAASVPAYMAVTGSPITTNGTLAFSFASGTANTVFARPSGSSGVPTFRVLNELDLAFSDITTGNVSTSAHGFAPKAPNDATKYLDGTGAYSVPASGASFPLLAPNGTAAAPSYSFSGILILVSIIQHLQ